MPELAGLVPALGFAFNSRSTDQAGRVVAWCPVGFFDIGWYRPEQVASPQFTEVELSGVKCFATSDALGRSTSCPSVDALAPKQSAQQTHRILPDFAGTLVVLA